MYERKHQKLAPKKVYYQRIRYNVFIAFSMLLLALIMGITGYHFTMKLNFYDSLLNASMILSGMGPVDNSPSDSNTAKVFESLYAIFSGVTFLSIFSIIIAPILHRFFHRFHLEEK